MTARERFMRAHLTGMAQSPFTGLVVVVLSGTRYEARDALVDSGDDAARAEELGLARERRVTVQVRKELLPRRPEADTDVIEYEGRTYALTSIEGEDAYSPVWVLEGRAPMG